MTRLAPSTRARPVGHGARFFTLLGSVTVACTSALARPPVDGEMGVDALARSALSANQASSYATGVLVVFALLGALFLAFRWHQGRIGNGRAALRVQGCLGLGGKERLMVVQAEGERLLIGVAPGGVSLIRVLDAEAPDAVQRGEWLARALSEKASS